MGHLHGIYGSLSSFSEGELVKAIPFVLLADGGGFSDERTAGSCFSGHDAFGLFRLPSPFLEIVFLAARCGGIVLPADRRRLLSDLSPVQQPGECFFHAVPGILKTHRSQFRPLEYDRALFYLPFRDGVSLPTLVVDDPLFYPQGCTGETAGR